MLVTVCPHCGKVNECHQHVKFPHYRPIDGDLSMCIGCGGWGIFCDKGERVRLPTEAEMRGILADPACLRHMAAWHSMRHTTTLLQ